MRRRIHSSWLIATGCAGFVVGVWLGGSVSVSGWWACLAVGLLGLCAWRRRRYVIPLVFGAGMVMGGVHGSLGKGELATYHLVYGQRITVKGSIREDPTTNDRHQSVLQIDSIHIGGHHLPGSLWVSVSNKADVKRGDEVVVVGELTEGFGTFAGRLDSARLTSLSRPYPGDVGRVVRDWFAEAVRRAVPEPQASLGIGYLTGQKSALPDDLAEALQIAGLSHIVVASGYNLTILVRLSRRLFMRISKFAATAASGLLVLCFMAVTGLSPSMSRAGLVSGLSLATWYYGRSFHPMVLLPFAAALTVAFQPSYAWGDLGWQLSFSAFAAVMIVAPLLQRYFFGEKEPGVLRQILGETVAAHVVTLPIIILAFGVVSNVAIPANLLIVPLVPLAMLLTFLTGVIALITPGFALMAGIPVTWLLSYMTTTAQFLAEQPWAQTELKPQWWMVALYCMLLIGAVVYMQRKTGYRFRESNIVA